MKNILAIDDNSDNLISLKAIIKDAFPEATIDTALNGPAGIELAIAKDPDVILLDILMPGMDGFEVCRRLKQNDCLRDIPVVFLTAMKQSKESRIEALELGAEAFLSKPIDVTELTAQIRAMIKIKEANKQQRDEKERLARLVAKRTYELEQSHVAMGKLLRQLEAENEAFKKSEALLQESETNYRYMFENNPQPMWIYDLETLFFLHVNFSAIEHYGYSKEEFLSMTIRDIRPVEDLDKLKMDIQNTKGYLYSSGEWRHRKKNGELIYVEKVSYAITFNNRPARHVLINDVTKRKQTEDRIRVLSDAVEQGPSSIVITNANGDIEFVNNKFTASTHYYLEDVRGKKPRLFNPGHLSEKEYDVLLETLRKGFAWKGEVLNRRKDKSPFWEEVIVSALMNSEGVISNYILIMNDITGKKQMLDDLIAAKEKAEENDRLKTAFLQNISHEIRTPMNAIIGFSRLLNEPDLLPDKRDYFTNIIIHSGEQLLSIITDIINIATIEAGQEKMNEKEINLNSICNLIYEQYFLKAGERKISFCCKTFFSDDKANVITDETKLIMILSNLVGNAFKFTEQGFIDFGYLVEKDYLEFYVEDTGLGIPLEMYEEVFKRFRQVETDGNRQFGGSGLGLSISKAYVELLGGKIWLTSELGKGSVFHFTIPLKKSSRT
jgi:PAS domain S-box-containing protein